MRPALCPLFACLLLLLQPSHAHGHDWQPFHWQMGSLQGGPVERLGMVLPITIDGVDCYAQLDTGANGGVIWHQPPASASTPAPAAAEPRRVLVEIAGARSYASAEPAILARLTTELCKKTVIASLGNAFFEQGTLTLDLGGARLAYTPQPLLATSASAQPLFYARWTDTGGHPLVAVAQSGRAPGYALLDTGATRFGIAATSAGQWATLTGNAPLQASDQVRKYAVRSWGRQIDCYETRAAGNFTLGSLAVGPMMAAYCVDQGFQAPVPLIGMLGLKPLGDRVLTIDYASQRWQLDEPATLQR